MSRVADTGSRFPIINQSPCSRVPGDPVAPRLVVARAARRARRAGGVLAGASGARGGVGGEVLARCRPAAVQLRRVWTVNSTVYNNPFADDLKMSFPSYFRQTRLALVCTRFL